MVVGALAAAVAATTMTTMTAAQAAPSTSDLTKQITTLSNKLEDITESYNDMNDALKKTEADSAKLKASLGPAQDALDAAGAQVNTMASSAYMTGQVGPVTAILDGPGDLLQRMTYLDQISRDRQRSIDTFTATTQDYGTRQAAYKATEQKQAAQVKVLAATKKDIESKIKVLLAKRKAAYGKAQESGSKYTGPIPKIAGSAGKAVTFAFNQLNEEYHFGAAGPDQWDCSGLTMMAWKAAGKSLPHNAAAQYRATARVSKSALKPGDLVFYRDLKHVAIYIGGNTIIAAPQTGELVKKESMTYSTPYGYGRVR
jgi:cell wall-associated NlpC family hydrolase